MSGLKRLESVNRKEFDDVLNGIPNDWEVTGAVRNAIGDFLLQRAGFLLDHLPVALHPHVAEQREFPLKDE